MITVLSASFLALSMVRPTGFEPVAYGSGGEAASQQAQSVQTDPGAGAWQRTGPAPERGRFGTLSPPAHPTGECSARANG